MCDRSSIEVVERTLRDAFRVFDTDRSGFIEPH
jgi:Ca2+-binding EF-hand superfamily protein